MPLTQVVSGNRILASDLNAFYNLLKGVAASGETVTLIYNNESLIFQPSSDPTAGTRVWTVKNNAGTVLASMRYDGLLKLLAAAADPATAVAGSLYFDTLLNALKVYDGTNWIRPQEQPQPNLVLNSDFSRRTVFGLAMPEVFADVAGVTTLVGTAPTAGSNVATAGAASAEQMYVEGLTSWSDIRCSAKIKLTSDANVAYVGVGKAADADNFVVAELAGGATDLFRIRKQIATVDTVVTSVAYAPTLNAFYWVELESQGTTYIAKLYTSTTAAEVKSSGVLVQTLTGTVADAGVATGRLSLHAAAAVATAAQFGGVATGNGGVYVETWLPESWAFTFAGTLGGQAIGYDESADSGPAGKQWAMRSYTPAASRTTTGIFAGPNGNIAPAVAYTLSSYLKTSGLGGSGTLVEIDYRFRDSAAGNLEAGGIVDAGVTSWTRKTVVATSGALRVQAGLAILINPSSTATGTAYFMLPQLEQGGAATAWRGAPADDAPITYELTWAVATTLATSAAEIEPRDLAVNLFMPWDGRIEAQFLGHIKNGTISVLHNGQVRFAGSNTNSGATVSNPATATPYQMTILGSSQVAAGKTRVSVWVWGASGTPTLDSLTSGPAFLRIVATRGK